MVLKINIKNEVEISAGPVDNINIDSIYTEIDKSSLFRIISIFLISIPCILSASYASNYIISTNTLDYRCKVPNCDVGENNREIVYDQPWLKYAIPTSNNGYESCFYYAKDESNIENENQCNRDIFNKSNQIQCTEFVYKTDEVNIQTEFNIHCDDSYKLSIIGSASGLGRLLFLPIMGMLSDKFGRLRVIVFGMFLNSLFGLIKSFSIGYAMYIVCEFLESSAGTSTFGIIYVLVLEWMSPSYRAIGTTFVVTSFPIGEMLMGLVAMYVHNSRHLIRYLYTPGLFVVFYFWLVPESPRWLLSTGRTERAITTFNRIAKFNGKTLSEKSIDMLRSEYSPENRSKLEQKETLTIFQQLRLVFGSKKLCLRFLNCCYLWITCCFCYYGLSLISTHIPGQDRYVSFIIVQAAEIPGAILPVLLLNRFGRTKLLSVALAIAGISSLINPLIPDGENKYIQTLLLFMVGKAAATFAFNILYIFTAELWPTNLRTTIMNMCSMTGRLGSALAPLLTLLIAKTPYLPFVMFGSTAFVAAAVVLQCPETFKKELPDTVQDSKDI